MSPDTELCVTGRKRESIRSDQLPDGACLRRSLCRAVARLYRGVPTADEAALVRRTVAQSRIPAPAGTSTGPWRCRASAAAPVATVSRGASLVPFAPAMTYPGDRSRRRPASPNCVAALVQSTFPPTPWRVPAQPRPFRWGCHTAIQRADILTIGCLFAVCVARRTRVHYASCT